jgi:hypothetical protein
MRHIKEAKFVAWLGRAPEDLASSWEFMKQLPFILKDIKGASRPARLQWYGPAATGELWTIMAGVFVTHTSSTCGLCKRLS